MTLYPYATQMNGEMGIQTDIIYKIPKGLGWEENMEPM